MHIDPTELKRARDRLVRAQGQIGGIVRMIDEGRDCTEILHQLSAANAALAKAGFAIIATGMTHCATEPDDSPSRVALEKAFLSLA